MRLALILVFFIVPCQLSASERQIPPTPDKQFSQPEERRAVNSYLRQMEAYLADRAAFERRAQAYWSVIEATRSERRRKRASGGNIVLSDYVLDQPPTYSGPPRPPIPAFIPRVADAPDKPRVSSLPVVTDFLRNARTHFRFVPERPVNEFAYKQAYARTALSAGIRPDQAVRIYGFEAGGNGLYDVQAGLEFNSKKQLPISTALGYNQLLIANTIGLVSKHGDDFILELQKRADTAKGEKRDGLDYKIDRLKRMMRYARSMPYRWSIHVEASKSEKGQALHALILDIDIGPLLQTQKLVNSIAYAKRLGISKPLTAAELEMFNLTGDGNGFDMISMPSAMREKVPTANFFQRGGYERNPVASRNNTVASLLAATDRKMDHHAALDGAKQLAAAFEDVSRENGRKGPALYYGATQ